MDTGIEARTVALIYRRVIPLFFTLMFFNYLDRVNVGFAALRMNADLGFSASVYGFGAGIFFAGYMVLQIPSNLMLHRFGARVWISLILVAWGLVSAATAFVRSADAFYALRFVLGLAEGGFLPGLAVYITHWFPENHRARAIAGYIIATSVSTIIGAPVAGFIITALDQALGLHGWQWMFLLEGLPAALFGFVVFAWLTDRPADAAWLAPEERAWLSTVLDEERARIGSATGPAFAHVLRDMRAWSLGLLFGSALVGLYGLLLWLPQIIKSMGGLSDVEVGFLTSVPSVLGVAGALAISRHSDRVGERKGHMAFCYAIAAVGLLASALVTNPVAAYVLLAVGTGATLAASPLFWTIAGSLTTGAAAALCIAFVNTVAQFGGLIGPWLIGLVKDATGSYTPALIVLAGFLLLAAIIAIFMPGPETRSRPVSVRSKPALNSVPEKRA